MSGKVTKELLEGLLPDWDVTKYSETSYGISRHSPAREEVVMSLQGENLGEMATFAEEYYNGFDAYDHAAVIYHHKHYGTPDEQRFYASAPGDLFHLIDDAWIIDNWYYEVGHALRTAWENEEDHGDDSE